MSRLHIANSRKDLKIILVGSSGCGKTSFCSRWIKGTFDSVYKATVMSDFSYKMYNYKGQPYKIQFWDLAGQDKNICTTKIFTKNSHGFLVVCDITNPQSLQDTIKWKKTVDDSAKFIDGSPLPCVLVQNKIDLINDDSLDNQEEIDKFAKDKGFLNYFRTSAKENIGIEECMEFLIENIVEKYEKYALDNNTTIEETNRISIVQAPKAQTTEMIKGKSGCC